MGLLDFFKDDNDEGNKNDGSFTHDAIAAAAAYEAAKAYEKHVAKNGKPDSHAQAKEILAGLTAAAVTHLVETKGFDAWDEHKERAVREKAHERLSEGVRRDYE